MSTSPTSNSCCCSGSCGSARWVVFGLLLFLLGAVATIYLKYRMGATDAYEQSRAATRIERRLKIEAEAKELLTTSGWTDQGKGIVRIPLQDAMALEIVALKQKQPRPAAYAVGAAVPIPASALPTPAAPAVKAATTAVKAVAPAPTATTSVPEGQKK